MNLRKFFIPLFTIAFLVGCQYVPEKCIKDPLSCIPTPSPSPTVSPTEVPSPTPTPQVTPSPTSTLSPTPSPSPTEAPPSGVGCNLPRGTGSGENCPRTTGKYISELASAVGEVQATYGGIFTDGGAYVIPGKEALFYTLVQNALSKRGFCSFLDGGNEFAVKKENAFSEQYAVLASDDRVRTGENSYRATCTPAWEAIPPSGGVDGAGNPPILEVVRVGDHCQNPSDGPKYKNHICIVTSTGVYRNPRTPSDGSKDSPCDREPALSDFCNGESQDDPRGVVFGVMGAENLGFDPENPQQVVVRFTPGVEFSVCARPFPEPVNSRGQHIPVDGSAAQCKSQTQH